jgi:pentatricopeptide repeat protein
MPNLRNLTWIDPVACSMVLMTSAVNVMKKEFIREKANEWTMEITLSKDAKTFSIKLLSCLSVIDNSDRKAFLPNLIFAMRSRGLQSEERNDLDAFTWETWCNLVLELDKADAISCLQDAVNELDIKRESEVILGPVVVASAEFIEKYPEEKETMLTWVNEQLKLLENRVEEQQQIAPSAAVFFASLNKKDEVLYWLRKATDEKAPLWRERVLNALIQFYAKKENFTEARRLLDEMQIQDEKDFAIAELAKTMAASHPVEAGFLLDEINEVNISSKAARNMLQQPSMLSAPQGIYQLLLHLQSDPIELASALEIIIERDEDGIIAESVKKLFLSSQSEGPSAAVLLALCKHPEVIQFVKAWKLEELMKELDRDLINEKKEHLHHFMDLLEGKKLIDPEEREMMKAKLIM